MVLGWGGVVSGACVSGHALLIPDLKDMSLVTLSMKTPRDFSKHQLVLHVAKSEMDKVRSFEPMVSRPWPSPWCSLPTPANGIQPLHTHFSE